MNFEAGYNSSPPSLPQSKWSGRTRHPQYRSVRRRSNGTWVSEVREPHTTSRIWLGTFPTPEKAAVAHDVAVLTLNGDNPVLNFPEYAHLLPRAPSRSHQDIQQAAQQAAREFTLPSSSTDYECLPSSREELGSGENSGYVDEEAMFNMPGLIDGMAEGMLLTPPALRDGFHWIEEDDMDVTLWEF